MRTGTWLGVGLTLVLVAAGGCADETAEEAIMEGDAIPAGGAADPNMGEELRQIEGGGELAGFLGRTDQDQPFENVLVTEIGEGTWQVDVGPAVALWREDMTASGQYTLTGTFEQVSSKGHPHGTGLIFGGANLEGPDQRYTYFMVAGDGTYLVKTREGDETFWHLPSGDWVAHDAVNQTDENDHYVNDLAVQVTADEVVFMVNGTEVHRGAKADLFTDGQYGMRANHNLTIRFSDLGVMGGM